MDYSEYLRRKQEVSNVYIARNKSVDSSFLTMQKQQKAAYTGSAIKNTPTYFKGNPTLNPILYDKGSCPADHAFTQGYSDANPLAQQERQADRKAGAVLCGNADYSTAPSGFNLKSTAEINVILAETSTIQGTHYNNGTAPGQWKPYGYGQNHYFPKADSNSQSTCCVANKYPHGSG